MDLSQDQIDEINLALERLEAVDPADLPEPAAELVELLSRLLEGTDET
ncbi:MAG TPA: hypothetical protein VFT85_08800 [Acidimicrobiia bacterium]|nr:hypothetical protein [Acidimicrobiia bacterium]